jgi:hypothetical protein
MHVQSKYHHVAICRVMLTLPALTCQVESGQPVLVHVVIVIMHLFHAGNHGRLGQGAS